MIGTRFIELWRCRSTRWRGELFLRAIPAFLFMGAITAVSHLEGRNVPNLVDDRIAHFIEYSILGVLLMLLAAGFAEKTVEIAHFASAFLGGALFSVTDEWHQRFVAGRQSSLKDIVFDLLGLLAAMAMVRSLLVRGRPSP